MQKLSPVYLAQALARRTGLARLRAARPLERSAAQAPFALWTALRWQLLQERDRWLLWAPVLFGIGVGLYFGFGREPPLWLALVLPAVALGAYGWCRRFAPDLSGGLARPLLLGLLLLCCGLATAQLRTALVAAPVLPRAGVYWLEATVLLVEDRIRGDRLTLGKAAIEGVAKAETPVRLRISRTSRQPRLVAGDRVRLRARLMAPAGPSEPFGFDFARYAYFEQLGAVGYGLGPAQLLRHGAAAGWSQSLARLRQSVANEISADVPGTAGGIGVALITGLRAAVPDRIWQEMQIAGTAHILSISGLHLSLVAGLVLLAVRIGLTLSPALALRLPVKKLAAACALACTFAYVLFSGLSVPAQRSFVTTALMLLAVMTDRNPFSLRLAALAACAVLATQPESLVGASFQMSFAAVIALVAVYETGLGRRPPGTGGLAWWLLLYAMGVCLTTVIASLATAPLAIYHFGRLPTYGIIGNLIAVPLTGFWIMPMALLGMLLLPFGWESVAFVPMGWAIELMLASGSMIASWPGATLDLPRPPPAALVATVLGGLWLALWRTPWRWLGTLGLALGVILMLSQRPPDLIVDATGRLVAARLADGELALAPWRRDKWITDGWLEGAGQRTAASWPAAGQAADGALTCDELGCILRRAGRSVALVRRAEALAEDCVRADLVLSYPRLEACPNRRPLIGPRRLAAEGGLALWLTDDGVDWQSVRDQQGLRPWSRLPENQAKRHDIGQRLD